MKRALHPIQADERILTWSGGHSFSMGVRDFFKSAGAIFRLAHKSDRAEFTLYLKLVALGILVVGTIGFLIKLVGNVFFG
jgi:protein translocase SEC61 complex gamma subunit